jgi:hypothetical protein
MVEIHVDEAYAFDILSIYDVKIRNCTDPNKVDTSKDAYIKLYLDMSKSIGINRMIDIIRSDEYTHLRDANEKTYYLVDKIRASDEVSIGKDIDKTNMERFFCKKKLQEKFFDGKLTEVKTQHE